MQKYKFLKNLWKAIRLTGIAAGSYFLLHFQDFVPPEYLTPIVCFVIEFLRNRIFGDHSKAIFRS